MAGSNLFILSTRVFSVERYEALLLASCSASRLAMNSSMNPIASDDDLAIRALFLAVANFERKDGRDTCDSDGGTMYGVHDPWRVMKSAMLALLNIFRFRVLQDVESNK